LAEVIEAGYIAEQILYPRAPFHFDGTVCKPSYFPGSDTAYEPGHFWQSMRFEGLPFGLRLDNLGSIEEPEVRLVVFSNEPLCPAQVERISAEVACRNDLAADLRAFYDGYSTDTLLAPVLSRWRGLRPSSYTSLYEYLVIATVLQNANVHRTVQMMENLFDRYGSKLAFDGRLLSAFWDPQAIQASSEEDLRAIKLGYRAKTLKRQADSFGPGGLDEVQLRGLPTADLKRALLSLYGVGPASVWYLLFGQFKRYEAFEYISPWEQRIFSRLLFDQEWVESKVILEEVEQRWGPYKMLAAHILFEDLFWRRKNEGVPWLEELIRL
jgi:3-methyladenine DNA glycosylase/8-oxoguanine DNA glycosylase